jgi:tight adherence protein B
MAVMLLAGMLMMAATLFGFAWIAYLGSRAKRRLKRRIERVSRPTGSAPGTRTVVLSASVRRQSTRSLLGRFGRDLAHTWPRAAVLRQRLDWAGVRLNAVDFAMLWIAIGVAVGLGAYLLQGIAWPLATSLGIIVATGLPHILISRRIAARQQRFVSQLPDAIDLIVRGVRSGLPVTEALQIVGQELPSTVGSLFQEVTGNVKLGKGLDEALALATRHVQSQEFKFFVISIAIQQETGGNLAEILQNLSTLIRRREQVKLKIKALSSEARASALIIGSLPFVMLGLIYVIDPDYAMKLFVDRRGWLLLGGGLLSLGFGLGIMKSMLRFEI